MSPLDKLHQGRVRRTLNVLLEAPFFYPEDDPDLFLFLRRHRAAFAGFFADHFGWELIVEPRCARLYKERWENRALKPSQHDVFDLSRRDDCVAFLLVLEHHERLLELGHAAADDPEPPRFYFGELLEFAVTRLAEELGDAAPGEAEVRKLLRGHMPTLLRYRFLREVEPPRDDPSVDRENLIYECLPGLAHYDVGRLTPRALAGFLAGGAAEAPAAAAGDEESRAASDDEGEGAGADAEEPAP